ncbi:MAG: nucleotidyltransferase family protein [Pirellulales bacterium]
MEKVRERLMRATAALEAAGIPYAVAGGNAVAAWVSRVDEAAVRNTQDVDILIRREDLGRAKEALGAVGFVYRHAKSVDMFLDGPNAKARDAIHIVFAGEKVRPEYLTEAPTVNETEVHGGYRVLRLDSLVRMMLAALSTEDAMLMRDLIDVELVDNSWLERLSPELCARLQRLLEDPE